MVNPVSQQGIIPVPSDVDLAAIISRIIIKRQGYPHTGIILPEREYQRWGSRKDSISVRYTVTYVSHIIQGIRCVDIPSIHLGISREAHGIVRKLHTCHQVLQVYVIILVIRYDRVILCSSQGNVIIDNLKATGVCHPLVLKHRQPQITIWSAGLQEGDCYLVKQWHLGFTEILYPIGFKFLFLDLLTIFVPDNLKPAGIVPGYPVKNHGYAIAGLKPVIRDRYHWRHPKGPILATQGRTDVPILTTRDCIRGIGIGPIQPCIPRQAVGVWRHVLLKTGQVVHG